MTEFRAHITLFLRARAQNQKVPRYIMPPLKKPRWEAFAQILAGPHPPIYLTAYRTAGFKGDASHAWRLAHNPAVAARITELQAKAGQIVAQKLAAVDELSITKVAVSRESLIAESAAALRLAANAGNSQGMVAAIRLMAELAQISLKAPDDVKQPAQHLHLHDASLIDRPPTETLEQWIERKRLEADARATSKLKLVGKDPAS